MIKHNKHKKKTVSRGLKCQICGRPSSEHQIIPSAYGLVLPSGSDRECPIVIKRKMPSRKKSDYSL